MKQDSILCFEMEAASITQLGEYLIIRGMCDYADSHKNKRWQEYASASAAAVFSEILYVARQAEPAPTPTIVQPTAAAWTRGVAGQ